MIIEVDKIGKKFNNQWIFRNLTYQFTSGNKYVIKGKNGSGKSTFLKILSSLIVPSEGKLSYSNNKSGIPVDSIFKHLSFCAPYQSLFLELKVEELIKLHFNFKNFRNADNIEDDLKALDLFKKKSSFIKNLSSGQIGRLKLILCLNSYSEIIALDEPLTNIDEFGAKWYNEKIDAISKDSILLVASNTKVEFDFPHKEVIMN